MAHRPACQAFIYPKTPSSRAAIFFTLGGVKPPKSLLQYSKYNIYILLNLCEAAYTWYHLPIRPSLVGLETYPHHANERARLKL